MSDSLRFNHFKQPKGLHAYLCGMDSPYPQVSPLGPSNLSGGNRMSDKARKIIKGTSMAITVLGVCGLVVSGATENDISLAVKVGTGIAAVIASVITAFLPKK